MRTRTSLSTTSTIAARFAADDPRVVGGMRRFNDWCGKGVPGNIGAIQGRRGVTDRNGLTMNADKRVEPTAQRLPQARSVILVVEDEVTIRLAVSLFLRDAGYLVVEAASADEAMRVMNATAAIAHVFSDVTMPGSIDGYGLAR